MAIRRPTRAPALPRPSLWLRGLVLVLALLASFVWLIVASDRRDRRALERRFEDRGAIAARFVQAYVADLASLERRQAQERLSGAVTDGGEFERIVDVYRFQTAGLVDADGVLLQVWPRKPLLIGLPVASRYEHVRTALYEGRVGVSSVVLSAVERVAIVAIAVPYDTPYGRRVISGGFDLQRSPLGAYLHDYTPISGAAAYIVDANGRAITASEADAVTRPSTAQRSLLGSAAALAPGGHRAGDEYVVVDDIPGTPWRVVLTAPTDGLYRSVAGPWSHLGWVLLALFAATSAAVLVLLRRLVRTNALLGATASTRERLLEQERVQIERLRDLDRMKDEFVALATHELRTPLTSIGGYLELLLADETRFAPDQLKALHTIRRNSDRVLRLVEDLLDLSRIESSELSLDMRLLSLSPIVREAVHEHTPAAAEKRIALTSSIPGRATVTGDAVRLRQVVDNLLSNAIKYTPDGGRVTLALVDTLAGVVLTVSDSGIGIPHDERQRLFEPFYRTTTARDRRIPGTGLGLAISKAIVDAHAGSISVADSAPGTAFAVTLPRAA